MAVNGDGWLHYKIMIDGELKEIEKPTYHFRFYLNDSMDEAIEDFDNIEDCYKLLYQKIALYGSSDESWDTTIEEFYWVENEDGESDPYASHIIEYLTSEMAYPRKKSDKVVL